MCGRLAAFLIVAARAPLFVRRVASRACGLVLWPPAAAIAAAFRLRAVKRATAIVLGPSRASLPRGMGGRLAAVVAVVAVRAPTASGRSAGLALRARAPSLPPPPLLPCEGTRPSRHPSFTRHGRPSGRCFARRCAGADLRQALGGRGLRARALAPRRRHRCCLQASGRVAGRGNRAVTLCASLRPSSFHCLAATWPLSLRSSLFRRRLREGARRAWLCGRMPRASRRCHCFRVRGRGHRSIPRSHGVRGRLAAVVAVVAVRAPISVTCAAGGACGLAPWPPAADIAAAFRLRAVKRATASVLGPSALLLQGHQAFSASRPPGRCCYGRRCSGADCV